MSSTLSLKQLINELEILESEAAKEIAASEDSESIEKLRLGFLGKKGKLSILLGGMKNLSNEERPLIGQRANVLKTQLQALIPSPNNSSALSARIGECKVNPCPVADLS